MMHWRCRAMWGAWFAIFPLSAYGNDITFASEPTEIKEPESDVPDESFLTGQAEVLGATSLVPDGEMVSSSGGLASAEMRKLMRPNFRFAFEWQGETNDIGISSYESSVSVPLYPIFGPPPPFVNGGFNYTRIDALNSAGLPSDLYETRFGVAWMRRWNDRWMFRLMGGASFATDGINASSDAWRFQGGAFAIYRRNPMWTWTFGAIALGRNDLPVLPAVGLIYQPSPSLRWDMTMPRPRVAYRLADYGTRQQWGYLGAALNGTTWGVERRSLNNVSSMDQLTYGDVRFVLGWESIPAPKNGLPFTRGRKLGVELGYVFSRDFEWESDEQTIPLDDSWLVRVSASF